MKDLPPPLPRICIFCGKPPENKNKEHVLPYWLLEMTGNPKRVVNHGVNWSTGKLMQWAFDEFVFPACKDCNDSWSDAENVMKKVVGALCNDELLSPGEYVLLLDWLDKVRIGLWLGHRYLQRTPVTPHFTIDTRVGRKDRMMAMYLIRDRPGLNMFGTETPIFQYAPTVFALRVNKVLLLNASWDWMCSKRCGYPFPKKLEQSVDTGVLACSDFRRHFGPAFPVMRGLIEPAVLLFQPAAQLGLFDGTTGDRADHHLYHCYEHGWPGRAGLGPLLRQHQGRIDKIDPDGPPLGLDCPTYPETFRSSDFVAQAYDIQCKSISNKRLTGNQERIDAVESTRRRHMKISDRFKGYVVRRTAAMDAYVAEHGWPDEKEQAALIKNGIPVTTSSIKRS